MATIYGTNGNDRADLGGSDLVGTNGNDRIYGYAGSDYILGLFGHDTIDAGTGTHDTVFAGDGDDAVISGSNSSGFFDGGAGVDTMIFTTGSSGSFHLGAGWASFGSAVSARFAMSAFENLSTGAGNDTIDGSSGRNVISSGAGHDVVRAGGGDDEVFAGGGDDYADGGSGNDRIRGEDGRDELFGGLGNDTLDGGNGNDLLWGGYGNDTMIGGRGNDTLDGGDGGFDTADYSGHVAAVTVDMAAGRAYSTINGASEVDSLFRIDKVVGSSYGDALYASATTELSGNGGNDWLVSGSGANVIAGGADRIHGGDGVDTMYGESGADIFVFQSTAESTPSLGGDTVKDFQKGLDRIDLSGIDANINASQGGDQAFYRLTGYAGPGWEPGFVAGTINVSHAGGQTYVHINTSDQLNQNGYDAPEMFLRLDGYHDLALSDFIL